MVATGTTDTPVNQNVLTLRNIEHYFANSGDISSKTNISVRNRPSVSFAINFPCNSKNDLMHFKKGKKSL